MTKHAASYCLHLVFGIIAASPALPARAAPPTSVDLSTYVRVGRYDLPESTRTPAPPNSLLAGEASGVTYNWDTDTLFVVGDGGTSVVQVSKTGQLIDSMTLAQGSSPQGTAFYDTEGVTYVGSGMFVFVEERDRQANLFTYVAGSTLQRSNALTVKLGTTIGNIGLEGLCWDPSTGGFLFVKEKDPLSVFQTGINFMTATATNGSPTAVGSTDLFNPSLANLLDFSDVFALSNLPSLTSQPDSSHLLIISQESGQVINVDRSGTVSSRLTIVADQGSLLSVPDMTMEGITMDRDGFLYIVNENGGGDSTHPQLWVYASSTTLPNLPPTGVSLLNQVNSLPENTNTATAVKVADISVADDGVGTNNLTLTGADASSFEVIGTALLLKAGTVLNAAGKPSYSVTVNVDDPSGGSTPDATANFSLMVTAATGAPSIVITEVAAWSSGNSPLAADWFEVTNIGTAAAVINGWKVDDNSNSFASAIVLTGVTSIAPGESVIFIESSSGTIGATFKTLWFGASPPANLQIGTYSGTGIGLSTGGDALNLYDGSGALRANVVFGASPTGPSFATFDNSAGLNNATISVLSSVGVNGGFTAAGDSAEVGSPGITGGAGMPVITIVATDASASEVGGDTGTFRISRTGSTTNALTVNYIIASGTGQASSSDYTPTLTGVVTIPSGQAFTEITITPVSDSLSEGSETVSITLGDTGSYDVGTPGSASVVIADNASSGTATLVISEVAAWSSGNSPIAADWFEVTNIGTAAANITGWKVDDNSNAFGSAVALNGITSIAPGESVIFIESASTAVIDNFKAVWFGAGAPAGLLIGTYTGSGIGLSTSGDALNLYNSAGALQANVVFGASPAGPTFATFDNAAGLDNATISTLSAVSVNGAFAAASDPAEIGSPGTIRAAPQSVPALPPFALWLCALALAITGRQVVARRSARDRRSL